MRKDWIGHNEALGDQFLWRVKSEIGRECGATGAVALSGCGPQQRNVAPTPGVSSAPLDLLSWRLVVTLAHVFGKRCDEKLSGNVRIDA